MSYNNIQYTFDTLKKHFDETPSYITAIKYRLIGIYHLLPRIRHIELVKCTFTNSNYFVDLKNNKIHLGVIKKKHWDIVPELLDVILKTNAILISNFLLPDETLENHIKTTTTFYVDIFNDPKLDSKNYHFLTNEKVDAETNTIVTYNYIDDDLEHVEELLNYIDELEDENNSLRKELGKIKNLIINKLLNTDEPFKVRFE